MTTGIIEDHHADDRMRCAADHQLWPCEAFLLARRRADRRGSSTALLRVPPLRTHSTKEAAEKVAG